MHSVSPAAGAAGELAIGERDPDGNVLIEMRVDGLPPLPASGWYELALANNGEVGAVCGTFVTSGEETTVRFTVGYDLKGSAQGGPLRRLGRDGGRARPARLGQSNPPDDVGLQVHRPVVAARPMPRYAQA